MKRLTITAFLAMVDLSGIDNPENCWIWKGAQKGNGYGNVNADGEFTGAHRQAYQLFIGPIPEDKEVCHACDTRLCVNPDHLFLGTRSDNMQDCMAKGRAKKPGHKHLTADQLNLVVSMLKGGMTPRKVSVFTGIKYVTISGINAGRAYAKKTGLKPGEKLCPEV